MSKSKTPSKPSQVERFDVFVVQDYKHNGEDKTNWMRVGAAFPHGDGKGFNVELQAVPTAGNKLVIRLHEEKEQSSK